MDNLLYKDGSMSTYATSIAATWVWAPAIFVSSSMAYFNGIYGFLWFIIPNALTLILFGYIAQKFVSSNKTDSYYGLWDIPQNNNQKLLHTAVSLILLISSTCVQFVGLNSLISYFFKDLNLMSQCIAITILCYAYIYKGGFKLCVISDKIKYFLILIIGMFLLTNFINTDLSSIKIFGINNTNFIDISLSFGIISAIGLLSAPYVDQTFWQRVFSIPKDKIYKTFILSSIYFMLIPIVFGIMGFLSTNTIYQNYDITISFNNIFYTLLLFLAIILALVATIDSNICALQGIVLKISGSEKHIHLYTILLLLCSCLIVSIFNPSIIELFLIYGTIRTSIAIPTILIIFNRYDLKRLFYFTLCSILLGSSGYIYMSQHNQQYSFIFTILALLIPIIGYKRKTIDKI